MIEGTAMHTIPWTGSSLLAKKDMGYFWFMLELRIPLSIFACLFALTTINADAVSNKWSRDGFFYVLQFTVMAVQLILSVWVSMEGLRLTPRSFHLLRLLFLAESVSAALFSHPRDFMGFLIAWAAMAPFWFFFNEIYFSQKRILFQKPSDALFEESHAGQ